jgi:biopolymer transport protein ExbB
MSYLAPNAADLGEIPRIRYTPLRNALWIGLLLFLALATAQLYGQTPSQGNASTPKVNANATDQIASDAGTLASESSQPALKSKNLLSYIKDGGYLMIPLLICSFTLLVFAFERMISLRSSRIIPGPFVNRLVHQLEEGQIDKEEAMSRCLENGSIAARVCAAGIKKWGRSAAEMEQSFIDAGERASHELRRFLRVFNGLATIGPLLGLLGTTFGIIQAFNDISSSDAMGRMEKLSSSISEALFTTATGLAVAIPSVVASMYFSSCVDRLLMRLDELGQDVVGAISTEALQERAKTTKPRKAA